MQHSLEAYFLVNFMVDTALLAVVARANACMRLRRVILSGVLAASYAILTRTVSVRLAHPAIQLVLLFFLSLLLCGEAGTHLLLPVAIQLAGGTMILGGTGMLTSQSGQFLPGLLGAGLLLASTVFCIRRQRMLTWDVTVSIVLKNHSTTFRALIDTGNRLREPISGIPVLITESRLLRNLDFNEMSCRYVRFGALGGGGTLRCFRPDAVFIRRGDRFVRAPDVWVAIYPHRLPGPAGALAPPSFAVIDGNPLPEILSKRGDI